MYSLEEIILMRESIKKTGLSYPEDFGIVHASVLQKICNGIGPDRWHESVRKIMTFCWRTFELAAMIHDFRYEYSDGTRLSRICADKEFVSNAVILLKRRYPAWKFWLYPAKIAAGIKLKAAAESLRIFGNGAWMEAYRERMESREKV